MNFATRDGYIFRGSMLKTALSSGVTKLLSKLVSEMSLYFTAYFLLLDREIALSN